MAVASGSSGSRWFQQIALPVAAKQDCHHGYRLRVPTNCIAGSSNWRHWFQQKTSQWQHAPHWLQLANLVVSAPEQELASHGRKNVARRHAVPSADAHESLSTASSWVGGGGGGHGDERVSGAERRKDEHERKKILLEGRGCAWGCRNAWCLGVDEFHSAR